MSSWQTSVKRKRQRGPKSFQRESPQSDILLQLVDAGLCGILFVAPFVFGGRHPLGRLIFIALACLTGLAWAIRQAIHADRPRLSNGASIFCALCVILVEIQLVPLPSDWVLNLNPHIESLFPQWTGDSAATSVHLGDWRTLSLHPNSTASALAILIAYVLLFVIVAQRLQTISDVKRMLQGIAIAAVLMSVFGVIQYFTSNGLFFWFYEVPYVTTDDDAHGSFTCKNHFAHFLTLGLGPLVAWLLLHRHETSRDSSRTSSVSARSIDLTAVALCIGLVVLTVGVMLTSSRGGFLAFGIAFVVTAVVSFRRGLLSASAAYGLAVLGVLVVGILSLSDYDRITYRLHGLTAGSIEQLDQVQGRRTIWSANIAAIAHGSWFGSGAGSHRDIYPAYLSKTPQVEYTHAENGPLQIATENGWLGIGLLLTAILLVGSWCWRAYRAAESRRETALTVAVIAGLLASLAHSMVDFVWYVPACMSITAILAACALRLSQLADNSTATETYASWGLTRRGLFFLATAGAVAWAISTAWGPGFAAASWDRYFLASIDSSKQSEKHLVYQQESSEGVRGRSSSLEAMIYHLRKVLAHDPNSSRAHTRLAGKCLQLFDQRQRLTENAMSVDQIRDAAMASQFASSAQLRDWLVGAFGENSRLLYQAHYHTRRALELNPLEGTAYLHLARLSFITGHGPQSIANHIAQGAKLRPFDRSFMFEAGRQLILIGEESKAIQHWQAVYNTPGNHQLKIIRLLAGRVPAPVFLELFQPNWQSLRFLWKCYWEAGQLSDLNELVVYAEQAAQQEEAELSDQLSASAWHALSDMQAALDRPDDALQSLNRAYKIDPTFLPARRAFGQRLLLAQYYQEAERHLKWCLTRQPDNKGLQQELSEAIRLKQLTTTRRSPTTQYR